jgi:hypothetical protein
MRSVLARFALSGLLGAALAGCGTNGTSLAPGALPNDSGGGSLPISSQNPPGSTIPGLLIDGGVVVAGMSDYHGINTTSSDAQSALDAGTDPSTGGSGKPPVDPAGSHQITFNGNNVAQIVLLYTGAVPALYYSTAVPGQITPANYGAIVLYAAVIPGATPPTAEGPSVAIELTGGSNATSYDVRSVCGLLASKNTSSFAPLQRYVCALPAYGATAGTTGSVTLVPKTATTPAITTSFNVDTNIGNPRIANPGGTFTPAEPKLYAELIYGALTASASTGNTFDLDYVYAEAGQK